MPAVSMPTIAHVVHRMALAGAEVLAARLARTLSSRFRFVFFCLDDTGPLGKELADEGTVVECMGRRPGLDLSAARRIRRACRRHRVDLLHAHQYSPFFYSAVSRGPGRRPPILFTEHGRHYPDHRRWKRILANRLLLGRHDRVTAVGQFVRDALVHNEGLPGQRIEVIHNGIDVRGFAVPDPDQARQDVRRELGLRPDQPVILQVARLHPVKNVGLSVEAIGLLHYWRPDVVLLVAGEGEERSRIERQIREGGLEGNVRLLGLRRDIPRLMAAADAFCLSSLSEGVSVTLLEAMAAGVPIAATDVGGNAEIVLHEETGLLSPRDDAAALGTNLRRLLEAPVEASQYAAAGRRRVEEEFDEVRMHERFARIYGRMLGGVDARGE